MIRNLKALGLALVAVFALSAVSSSAASANVAIFDSVSSPTVLTGTSENTQVFIREGIEIKCTHAKFSGKVIGTSVSIINLAAEYTTPTCSGPLGSEVHVNFTANGCGYVFTGTASRTATAQLVCTGSPTGVTITPTVFGSSLCTITVPEQKVGGHVAFANIANGDVTAETTASAITSIRTGNKLCGENEHNATATYTGNVIIEGETDSATPTPVNINVT